MSTPAGKVNRTYLKWNSSGDCSDKATYVLCLLSGIFCGPVNSGFHAGQ